MNIYHRAQRLALYMSGTALFPCALSSHPIGNRSHCIIKDAEKTLGRPLKDYEKIFITSRIGGIALEMIHDTVKTAEKEKLESYLGSERQQSKP